VEGFFPLRSLIFIPHFIIFLKQVIYVIFIEFNEFLAKSPLYRTEPKILSHYLLYKTASQIKSKPSGIPLVHLFIIYTSFHITLLNQLISFSYIIHLQYI
jgi:hypothetical protein